MLQVGRAVWSKYLRALLHMARTTVTEQEGTEELINPWTKALRMYLAAFRFLPCAVCPGHLTTETNTNRTLLEV